MIRGVASSCVKIIHWRIHHTNHNIVYGPNDDRISISHSKTKQASSTSNNNGRSSSSNKHCSIRHATHLRLLLESGGAGVVSGVVCCICCVSSRRACRISQPQRGSPPPLKRELCVRSLLVLIISRTKAIVSFSPREYDDAG